VEGAGSCLTSDDAAVETASVQNCPSQLNPQGLAGTGFLLSHAGRGLMAGTAIIHALCPRRSPPLCSCRSRRCIGLSEILPPCKLLWPKSPWPLLTGTLAGAAVGATAHWPVSSPDLQSFPAEQETVRLPSSTLFRPCGCTRPPEAPAFWLPERPNDPGPNQKTKGRDQ